METNENFRKLIALSMEFIREGSAVAEQTSADFPEAMKLLTTKQARLRLIVEYDPLPSVTCELVDNDSGGIVGQLFSHQARAATVN